MEDWRIAYFKESGHVKPCFINPQEVRCFSKSAVLPPGLKRGLFCAQGSVDH